MELLSPHRRIELRVAVLIWLSNVVWSRGIIGRGRCGNGGGSCGGVRRGDKTFESIAEWLPRKKYLLIYKLLNCMKNKNLFTR